MVTRDDVARAAGVSSAVVSYVVNGGPRPVSPRTAERVHRAIEQLGYRPNRIARALAMNRTYALALIVPDNSNPFFASLAQLVETAAFKRGYTLLLANTMEEPDKEVAYVEAFLQRAVDGFIIAPTVEPSEAFVSLATEPARVVLIDRDDGHTDFSRVLVDNQAGGYSGTKHLIEHGHSRIALLNGPLSMSNVRLRGLGWYEAMVEARLPTDDLPVHTPISREQAYHAALELLRRDDPPTAIFAAADELALGVYRAARDLGLRIPADVALVSFDSSDTAEYLNPGLSAVRQPIEQMADMAIQRLLEQLDEPEVTRDVLPVQLVARGSCGCPDI